jgi:hypothetical protein
MSGSTRSLIGLVGALALVAAVTAWAGEKTLTASDTPRYDARAEYVVKATVAGIKTHPSVMGYQDMHVVLTTTVGDMEVHLGPVSYLAKRGFELKPGDEVVVTGCKTTWEGHPVIVARNLKAGDRSITLRSLNGKPAWPKNLVS